MNEDEDRPFIEPPKELDDDPDKNGLICFINMDRPCGADCMAYTTAEGESPYLNRQQNHCALIVGIERLGRHTGGLLSLLRRNAQDAKRTGGAVPPSPVGGG